MTETAATSRWAWTIQVPATVLDDPPMLRALEQQAFLAARRQGLTPADGPVEVSVAELSPVGVAMAATVDTTPGSLWHGMPAEVIEAEVAARETAARGQRMVRVEFDVLAEAERPVLRELQPWAAQAVLEQALDVDAARRADTTVCGSPANRHDFLPRVAERLRDGRVQSAPCQKCGRDVTRGELVGQAEAEARGERWWER